MIEFVIEIVVSEKIYQDSRADSNCQILVKITQNIVIILNGNINISVKQNDKIFWTNKQEYIISSQGLLVEIVKDERVFLIRSSKGHFKLLANKNFKNVLFESI